MSLSFVAIAAAAAASLKEAIDARRWSHGSNAVRLLLLLPLCSSHPRATFGLASTGSIFVSWMCLLGRPFLLLHGRWLAYGRRSKAESRTSTTTTTSSTATTNTAVLSSLQQSFKVPKPKPIPSCNLPSTYKYIDFRIKQKFFKTTAF